MQESKILNLEYIAMFSDIRRRTWCIKGERYCHAKKKKKVLERQCIFWDFVPGSPWSRRVQDSFFRYRDCAAAPCVGLWWGRPDPEIQSCGLELTTSFPRQEAMHLSLHCTTWSWRRGDIGNSLGFFQCVSSLTLKSITMHLTWLLYLLWGDLSKLASS